MANEKKNSYPGTIVILIIALLFTGCIPIIGPFLALCDIIAIVIYTYAHLTNKEGY
jgi:hypothetical protein